MEPKYHNQSVICESFPVYWGLRKSTPLSVFRIQSPWMSGWWFCFEESPMQCCFCSSNIKLSVVSDCMFQRLYCKFVCWPFWHSFTLTYKKRNFLLSSLFDCCIWVINITFSTLREENEAIFGAFLLPPVEMCVSACACKCVPPQAYRTSQGDC